jgi:hypothetical protein
MSTPVAGSNPVQYNPQTQTTYAVRFDDPAQAALVPQFLQAQQDRQNFANDIYRTLLAVTGVPPAATPGAPNPQELAPRRWLAQLAVNIVDFIDEDDISTPFNFYNTDDGLPVANIGDPNTNVPQTNILVSVNGAPTPTPQATPKYWVFGTELPHVVLNEALAETPNASATAPANSTVNIWLELYNPFQSPNPTTQQQDGYAVPLYMPAPAGSTLQPYSPYRIEVWNGGTTPGAVVAGPFNDNVLGAGTNAPGNAAPTNPITAVDYTEFQTPANVLKTNVPVTPQTGIAGSYVPGPVAGPNPTDPAASFFLLGPTTPLPAGFRDPFVAQGATPPGTVPQQTSVLRNAKLTYTAPFAAGVTDERTNGLTILVRRLANPHLPWNNQPTFVPTGGSNPQINPLYNPYITVDYMDKVPLRDQNAATSPNGYASRGKRQPYAGLTKANIVANTPPVNLLADSPVYDSGPLTLDPTSNVQHTFGTFNKVGTTNSGTLANPGGAADWLVHLDRQVVSPMELLNVSGFQPYQLTQQFVLSDKVTPVAGDKFQHLVPWFDPLATGAAAPNSNRLYRLFEFMDTNNRGAGNPVAGRHSGKINLNAIWDFETFQALCDAQASNHFTSSGNLQNPLDVEKIWTAFISSRSPGTANGILGLPGPVAMSPGDVAKVNTQLNPAQATYSTYNKPLLPLSTGLSPGNPTDVQNPNARSINDTLLQAAATNPNALSPPLRLFEAPNNGKPPTPGSLATSHPYQRFELLTKIFNNVTTRSNVFAVWITVGFFDYNPATRQLGAEIGRSEGRNVRHRLFAIVDRSNANAFTTTTTAAITPSQPMQQGTQAGSMAFGMQSVALTTTGPIAGDPNNAQVVSNGFTGMNWAISTQGQLNTLAQVLVQPLVLVYDPGVVVNGVSQEEVVVATPVQVQVNPTTFQWTLQAAFTKSHAKGATVQCRGNPGPWLRYDPRQDTGVVLHYSIIE